MITRLTRNEVSVPAKGSSSATILRALSDHSREGILVVDCESRTVVEANVRMRELFGLDENALMFRTAEEAVGLLGRALRDPAAYALQFKHFLDLPEANGRLELVVQEAEEPTLLAYVTPVRDECGVVTAKLWSFSDTSIRRALEKGLRESQRLEPTARLAAGIVHDSNNLLTVVLGQLYLAGSELHAVPKAAAAIHPAVGAAEKCAKLLKTVLRLARQQEGHPEVVQWESLLREVEELVRAAAPGTVAIYTRYENDLPPILANPVQMHQVVMNLAFNAIDAMPDGGELEFSLSQRDEDVCLSVTDSGHGIPRSVKDRIFEPFFTTKGEGKGTGLGLHMVATIVREHGGTIRCDSVPGVGTTFHIGLPRAPSVPVALSQAEAVAR